MSTTQYLTCAETAKLLREALKAAYPGIKFSVRSDTYAGGASIRVVWTDGPVDSTVDLTAKRYAGASFDGTIDLKSYHSSIIVSGEDMREVHFGADFVFTEREISPALIAGCLGLISEAPNGIDSHGGQCGHCGNWYQGSPEPTCWVAPVHGSGRDFCCTRECAAKKLARYTDAALIHV